jgi:RNA polymerase sigma-70 factor (ECF subfamily)
MDTGASSYHRFLEGDKNGIVEIIRDYKEKLYSEVEQKYSEKT